MKSRTNIHQWVLGRVLIAIFKTVQFVYAIFFAWWLDNLLRNRSDRKFSGEVCTCLGWLLEKRKGVAIANDEHDVHKKRLFDLAFATFRFPNFDLRLSRIRGELEIFIRPLGSRGGWEPVAAYLTDRKPSVEPETDMAEAGMALDRNWPQLISAVAPEMGRGFSLDTTTTR